VITEDTVLDSDLQCPADGLVIGADDVTLDFAGHTLSGGDLFSIGVDNSSGYDRSEIKNGVIRYYEGIRSRGIASDAVHETTVRDMSITADGSAIEFFYSSGGVIEHNTVSSRTLEAIRAGPSADETSIVGNVVERSTTGIGVGLTSFRCLIKNNVVRDVEHLGIGIGPGGNHVVTDNLVTGSIQDGLDVVGSSDNLVRKNVVVLGGRYGLVVDEASRNLVEKNTIHDYQVFGILVQRSADNVIEKNEASGNGLDGIRMFTPSGPNLFRHNEASGNNQNGFHISPAGQTLTGNTADANGQLGIDAAPGTIDGGGNKARGNGNPAQCVGVACK
jgi:parallel beta-helix repeat protein